MRERLAEPAQDLEAGDRDEERDKALPDPREIDDRRAGDDRHAAAVGVGEHPRWDLPNEIRRLEGGPNQHQLERIEVRDRDVIEEPGGVDERPGESAPCSEQQIDGPRGQAETISEQRHLRRRKLGCGGGVRRGGCVSSSG